MALQNFDQLNSISTKWYSKMNASKEEKDKRVDLSLLFTDIIIMFFDLIVADKIRKEELKGWLDERLSVVASKEIGKDNVAYINDWSKAEADKIVDSTLKNIKEVEETTENDIEETIESGKTEEKESEKEETITFEEFDVSIPKKEYWTSDIRGILIGIECASAIANYYELYDALQKGHTRKVWVSEGDDKVRATHQAVDHADIPINDLFQVGDSYLLFPGDVQNGASETETANCRCHIETY